MLEPQSPALFVLLIALFGVLMWRTLATRRAAFRVLAACLAFVPAMVFGVLAVNKYYGYYQTWGAMAGGPHPARRQRSNPSRPTSSSPPSRGPARSTEAGPT